MQLLKPESFTFLTQRQFSTYVLAHAVMSDLSVGPDEGWAACQAMSKIERKLGGSQRRRLIAYTANLSAAENDN